MNKYPIQDQLKYKLLLLLLLYFSEKEFKVLATKLEVNVIAKFEVNILCIVIRSF